MIKFLLGLLFIVNANAAYIKLPSFSGGAAASSTTGTSPYSILGAESQDGVFKICRDEADDADDCFNFTYGNVSGNLLISRGTTDAFRINEDGFSFFFHSYFFGPGNAADTSIFLSGNVATWNISYDHSASSMVVGVGTSPGTNDAIRIDTSGNVTVPVSINIADQILNPDRYYHVLCDFVEDDRCTLTAASNAGGGSGQAVTASTTGMNSTENALGVMDLITGTGTTGRAALVSAGNLRLGSQALTFYGRAAVSALSDGTNTYTTYIGFIDTTGAGDSTDGLYFRYSSANNSGEVF